MPGTCCENGCCNCLWKYYSPFVRTCGVLVAGALWAIGITQVATYTFYIYILFAALCVSLLELLIFVEPCCDRCCPRDGRCYVFWEYVTWLDNWKRAILYLLLSIFCYIQHTHVWAIVAGAILDLLALIYIIRTYRIRPEDVDLEGGREESHTRVGSRTYGRFHNEDAKHALDTADSAASTAVASDASGPTHVSDRSSRWEDEARYPGGNVPEPEVASNPFEDELAPDENGMDPNGDAGLTRYPP